METAKALLQCLEEENIWYDDGDVDEYIAAANFLGFEYDYCETDEEIEFAAWNPEKPSKMAQIRLGRQID